MRVATFAVCMFLLLFYLRGRVGVLNDFHAKQIIANEVKKIDKGMYYRGKWSLL